MYEDGIKKSFPIFQIHPDLIYLDSSATSIKPQPVLDALTDYYTNYSANIHRGLYDMSIQASDAYEASRQKVASFINAQTDEIIFTKNATESINLLAYCLRESLQPGDIIITSPYEHHANLLPWQITAKQTQSQLQIIPFTPDIQLDLEKFAQMLNEQVKVVSFAHASNVLGLIAPVNEIVSLVRQKAPNAVIILDAAQSATHLPINVQQLDVDALAFSGHKLFGPTGIGVLFAKKELLQKFPPYQAGGGTVANSDYDSAHYKEAPQKFEAGTPPIAEAIGLGAAIDWINSQGGMDHFHAQTSQLTPYLISQLLTVPGLKLVGNPDPNLRVSVAAFNIDQMHPHDISQVLSDHNMCIRAGHHCALPLHKKLGIAASARISLQIYNSKEDIDKTVEVLKQAAKMFQK